jgi:hypothetical protein
LIGILLLLDGSLRSFNSGGSSLNRGRDKNRGSTSVNWSWSVSADWSINWGRCWSISTDWGRCWSIGTDWSRCWSISWSWGWSIGWGRGSIGDWVTLVLDISNITRVGIKNIVGNNLGAAIGKGNTVSSVGGVSVPVLVGSKVNTLVAVGNSVLVVICWWDISVDRGRSVGRGWSISWSRCVLGSSSGNSQESRQSNKALKKYHLKMINQTIFKQQSSCMILILKVVHIWHHRTKLRNVSFAKFKF